MAQLKVGLFGLVSCIVAAVVAQVTTACPDLASQWPTLLTTGILAGVGLWMNKPKA